MKETTALRRRARAAENDWQACKRELAAERKRTDALIASLPMCEQCGVPATGLNEGACDVVCGKHAAKDYIEDEWARPLRAILASRKRTLAPCKRVRPCVSPKRQEKP